MVSLTNTLDTERQGAPTINPGPANPSIFEGLADMGTGVLKAQSQADETTRIRAASARQARLDAEKQEGTNAENDLATSLLNLNAPSNFIGDQANGAATADANAVGQTSQRMQGSVAQGRMTKQTYELRLENEMRTLFAKYPNQRGNLYKTLKEWNVNHPLMAEYESVEAQQKSVEDAINKSNAEAISWATTKGGLNPQNTSPDELIRLGREGLAGEAKLEQLSKQVSMKATQAGMAREAYNFDKDLHDDDVMSASIQSIGPQLAGLTKTFNQLATMPGVDDSRKLAALQPALQSIDVEGKAAINDALLRASKAGMSPAKQEQLRTQLNGYVNGLKDMITGDIGIVQSNLRTYNMVQQRLRLNAQEALPFYTEMKEIFGSQLVNENFMSTILSNKDIVDGLTRELKGFTGLRPTDQRVHVANAIALIKGETGFSDLTPAQARQALPTVLQAFTKFSSNINDPDNLSTATTTLGSLANAAVELNASSGRSALNAATNMLTAPKTIAVLKAAVVGPEKEVGRITADATRAATQNVLNAWKGQEVADPYFDIKFNKGTGQYQIVRNNNPAPTQQGASVARFGYLPQSPIVPSTDLKRKADGLNQTVGMLVKTSDIADDLPTKGATSRDLANFYANGVPLPGMKNKEGQVQPNFEQLVEKAKDEALGNLGRIDFNDDYTGPRPLTQKEIHAKYPDNPNVDLIERAATQYGVPVELALNLVDTESSFNPSASSGVAFGLGQVTKATAKRYGVSDPSKLSPERMASLSMRILSDNYKRLGKWQDAVSAYHSGVDLETARREGRSDGNMRTVDYVRKVHG